MRANKRAQKYFGKHYGVDWNSPYHIWGNSYTTYSLDINNKTNDTIKMSFAEKSSYAIIKKEYLFFPPDTIKTLYGASGRTMKNPCGYTGIKENEVVVSTSSGRQLIKDISNVNNWHCSGNNQIGWKMTFVINESDLQ